MSESFLEEQLKRIREMTERMSRATNHTAEVNCEIARPREASRQGPLHECAPANILVHGRIRLG